VRSCTDAFFEAAADPACSTRSPLLRTCTGEIDFPGYTELVHEATDFLSGRSRAVKQQLAGEMEKASAELDSRPRRFTATGSPHVGDPVAAGINPRSVEEADVFAIHQEAAIPASKCSSSAPDKTGAPRLFSPRREILYPGRGAGLVPGPVLRRQAAPKLILLSHAIEECELLADALSIKAGFKVEVTRPARRKEGNDRARAPNAREALGRKLADTATQEGCCRAGHHARPAASAETDRGLRQQPHPGHQRGRAMIVAGPDGFIKNQYRKFNIKSEGLTPVTITP